MSPYYLTSTVIPPSFDGNYEYHQLSFLIPHEAFRRELARAEAGLLTFDVDKYAWKSVMFHEWYSTFLLPALIRHHHLEADIIFPFFLNLGVEVPKHRNEDHLWQAYQLNKIRDLATLVKNLAVAGSAVDELNKQKFNNLKINRFRLC